MPPLQPQSIEIRLGKREGKASNKLSLPGTFDAIKNMEMDVDGRYQRRPGTKRLDAITDGVYIGAQNVHDHGGEILFGTPDSLMTRVDGAQVTRGSITMRDTRVAPINNTAFQQGWHDAVRHAGYDWHVWQESRGTSIGGIRYAVIDVETGAYVVADGVITTTVERTKPRIFAVGSWVLIVYLYENASGPTASVLCKRIATATPSSVSSESIIESTDTAVSSGGDAEGTVDGVVVSSTEVTVVYQVETGGTNQLARIRKWDVSSMASAAVVTEGADNDGVSTFYSMLRFDASDGYHLARTQLKSSGELRVDLLTAPVNLASITVTNLKSIAAHASNQPYKITGYVQGTGTWTAHLLAGVNATNGDPRYRLIHITRTSGGVTTEVGTRYGFVVASKPWTDSYLGGSTSRHLLVTAPVGVADNTDVGRATAFVMDFLTGQLVGRAYVGRHYVGNCFGLMRGPVPDVIVNGTGVIVPTQYFVTPRQTGCAVIYVDQASRKRWIEAAGVTALPGSWPLIYDGVGVSEMGFEHPPSVKTAVVAGGSLTAGTYWYRAVWRWIDGTGRLHQSDPSVAVSATTAAGNLTVRLTIESLTATLKKAPVQDAVLAVYRTTKDPSSASGAAFYLMRGGGILPTVSGFVTNNTAVGSFTFDDNGTVTDAILVTNERLYTLGDKVLPNTPPEPMDAAALWGQRMWHWDGDVLFFTKLIVDDFGIAHTDTGYVTVHDEFGDGVAVADAGDRLLAFKKSAIYQLTGQGPDDTGNGTFSPIDRLELPLGARSALGVVSTEIGVFFQDDGTGGIWRIGSDGPEFVGRPIQDLMSGLTIVEARLVANKRQVRFATTEGTTLVYDLLHRQWTTFDTQPTTCAAVIDGVYHYLASNGDARYDDASTWTEGRTAGVETGTKYQSVMEFSWLSFNKLGGYQRTYSMDFIGELLGAHTLSVAFAYRFWTTEQDLREVSSDDLLDDHGYRVRAKPSLRHQQATAIKVRIADDSPITAGFALEAVTALVGLLPGKAFVPRAHIAQEP